MMRSWKWSSGRVPAKVWQDIAEGHGSVELVEINGKWFLRSRARRGGYSEARIAALSNRSGAARAYGWCWRSRTTFCQYYFGSFDMVPTLGRVMKLSRDPSLGKAALKYILPLFENDELCADCRWPAAREAAMPPGWLPLNACAREADDIDMAAVFRGSIQRTYERLRVLEEKLQRLDRPSAIAAE